MHPFLPSVHSIHAAWACACPNGWIATPLTPITPHHVYLPCMSTGHMHMCMIAPLAPSPPPPRNTPYRTCLVCMGTGHMDTCTTAQHHPPQGSCPHNTTPSMPDLHEHGACAPPKSPDTHQPTHNPPAPACPISRQGHWATQRLPPHLDHPTETRPQCAGSPTYRPGRHKPAPSAWCVHPHPRMRPHAFRRSSSFCTPLQPVLRQAVALLPDWLYQPSHMNSCNAL